MERDGPATLKADEQKRLEAALLTKVCKCVKDRYLRHKFRYEILGIYPEAIPPEALCQASIYNNRGLAGIDLKECNKRFACIETYQK